MTKEEKELLLKDLNARLPYGIEASVRGSDEECISLEVLGIKGDFVWVRNKMFLVDHFETIEAIKPYLRPMSSMTEEEEKEYNKTKAKIAVQWDDYGTPIGYEYTYTIKTFDWLNSHHFDYRGLIERGLALEAPEGMYTINN